VRDVHQVDIQPLQDSAEFKVSFGSRPRFEQGDGVKVRREKADLLYFFGRPDEKVFGAAIQSSQGAHDIPRVSADAKFRHAADIEGDPHGTI
jgi:hypothetical protein